MQQIRVFGRTEKSLEKNNLVKLVMYCTYRNLSSKAFIFSEAQVL